MTRKEALAAARKVVSTPRFGRKGEPQPYKVFYPWKLHEPNGPSTESAYSYTYQHAQTVAAEYVALIAAVALGACQQCCSDAVTLSGTAEQRLANAMKVKCDCDQVG